MWQKTKVSVYDNCRDNTGQVAEIGDILFSRFAIPHNGIDDLGTIITLRKLDRGGKDYTAVKTKLKSTLQAFTPGGILRERKTVVERSGFLQLDFDRQDISMYDIDELKRCVGSLPFIAYCGLSASGEGFYALALIAEPERLKDYAEHIFQVLQSYGIKADTSKGRNANDLRYVSYDANPVINDNPIPLKVNFRPVAAVKNNPCYEPKQNANGQDGQDGRIMAGIKEVSEVIRGDRWKIVQKVAYTLGGINEPGSLDMINQAIRNNNQFNGEEKKYMKCAADCYAAGQLNPMPDKQGSKWVQSTLTLSTPNYPKT